MLSSYEWHIRLEDGEILNPKWFRTNVILINVLNSLGLRCTLRWSPYYTSPFCGALFIGTSYVVVCDCKLYQLEPSPSSFLLTKPLDWFGCQLFVCVGSMLVAQRCLPPPTLVLLNGSCGSPAVGQVTCLLITLLTNLTLCSSLVHSWVSQQIGLCFSGRKSLVVIPPVINSCTFLKIPRRATACPIWSSG